MRHGRRGAQRQRFAPAVLDQQRVAVGPFHQLAAAGAHGVSSRLRPLLLERAAALEGIRHLRVVVSFVAGADQAADLVFVEPASQPARVQAALVQQLLRLRWPSEAEVIRWTLLECGELAAPQLTLFPDSPQSAGVLADLAQKLSGRCGGSLLRATLPDANHPVLERRGVLLLLEPADLLA